MGILFFLTILYMMIGFASPAVLTRTFDIFSPSMFLFVSYLLPLSLGSLAYFSFGLMQDNETAFMLLITIILVMTTSYLLSYIFALNYKKNIWDWFLENFSLNIDASYIEQRIKLFLGGGLFAYFLLLVLLIILTGFDPLTSPLWFRIRASHDYGFLYGLYQFLPIYLIIYAFYFYHQSNTSYSNFIYKVVMIFALMTAFVSGSRGMIMQMVFSIFIFRKIFQGKKISRLSACIFFVLLIIFVVGYQFYRVSGTIDILMLLTLADDISLKNAALWEFLFRYDVLMNLYKILNEIDQGNIAYLYGKSLLETLTLLVPRTIYTNKPNFTSMELHKYFSSSVEQGTLDFSSSYMMAEAFINFHIFGVCIYSAIWGVFMAGLDKGYFRALKNKESACGYLILYLPICLYLPFLQDGFNGMFFQQIIIGIVLAIIQLILLRIRFKY